MACSVVIAFYVQHELSFDRSNHQAERISRLVVERSAPVGTTAETATPPPLAPALLNDFPQIVDAVRFLSLDNPTPLVSHNSSRFYEKRLLFADGDLFRMFDIPFSSGDPETALQKPGTVVITRETANRYFGNTDPLGKTITLNGAIELEVTGVVENSPSNSTLQYDLLVSFSTLRAWLGSEFVDNWQNNSCQTYILASNSGSAQAIAAQLPGFITKHLGNTPAIRKIFLQPLERIHLYSTQDFGLAGSGDIQSVYLLSVVAFFILLIAFINFMNLTTARSFLRAKEVGIRKVVGAARRQLVGQFLGEAVLVVVIAMTLAAMLVEISIPSLNAVTGINLAGYISSHPEVWILPLGSILLGGIVCGTYPAFVLASLAPVQSLKGIVRGNARKALLRKAMVVAQFALTIVLSVGAWVVFDQMRFVRNRQLGFARDQVIVVPIRDQNLRQNTEALKAALREYPGVLATGSSALLPGGPVGKTRFHAEGVDEPGTMSMLWVDQDFVGTLGIGIVAGRDFSENIRTDASEAFLLNEEAVRELGWGTPAEAVGKTFELIGSKKGKVIGVVRDFNVASLHRRIEPLVLHIWPWMNYILVRVDVLRLSALVGDMQNTFARFDPGTPFTFTFLDDNFERYYQADERLGKVFGFFTLLAIAIACTGLLSLSAFIVERRTKEIGVRKVLGASVAGIIGMLTREIIVLVLLANVVAWPVAYVLMNSWLQDFAYRINLGAGTFLLAGAGAVAIAVLTAGTQAVRAAMANPVESLRFE
jgi:putative ABC transport system permease protein